MKGTNMSDPKRLCLHCFEAWVAIDEKACRSCQLMREIRKAAKPTNARQYRESTWWGPTSSDVNPEDIESGFSIDEI